ncbi:MAG: DUF4349 domain-containing protein [Saprospiraceae bacterium]
MKPVLLREASCRMEVEDLTLSLQQIEHLISTQDGYIGQQNREHLGWQEEASLSIRIPAKQFDHFLDTLKRFARFMDYQRISTLDVTEEYVDITARLHTKKAVRDRYEDILANKAKTVEEVLLAEDTSVRYKKKSKPRKVACVISTIALRSVRLNLSCTNLSKMRKPALPVGKILGRNQRQLFF